MFILLYDSYMLGILNCSPYGLIFYFLMSITLYLLVVLFLKEVLFYSDTIYLATREYFIHLNIVVLCALTTDKAQ
jgi:hypothetical protein